MWVLGVRKPVEMIRETQRYSLKDAVDRIRQATLILQLAKDHGIPQQQVDMLYAALEAPKTLRVFSEEEGAEEHCQFGSMALLLFDWLDETL